MYDIVIVGAGPAGLSAAYTASKGARVLVVEKDDGIGINVRTSGVSWIEDMNRFGISKEYYNPIKRYKFYSPSNEVVIEDKEYRCCVLDVRRAYQHLATKAIENGAEIMLKTRAAKVLMEDSRVIGIRAVRNISEDIEIRSRLVIDASGFNSIIARDSGFAKAWRRYGVGVEYECYADYVEEDSWILMVGSIYSPAGYAWIFPINKHRVRIGVGVGRPESNAEPLELLNNILRDKIRPIDKLGRIQPLELHYGFIPNEGMRSNLVNDGLIITGDAAGQSNPLVLEGIRYAIEFGRLAGEVGAKALEHNCTRESLIEYEEASKRIEKRIDAALRVQKRWLALSDKEWDKEIEIIQDMSIDELIDFIRSDFSTKKMLRLAINHPKMIARQLFRMVID